MVKVYEARGFRAYVYSPPREHQPPHVHVECDHGGEVVVRLGDGRTPPSWQNHHMGAADAREAMRIVARHWRHFLGEWRRLHG
jgi:hypothetical protein